MRLIHFVLLLAFAGLAYGDTGGDIADEINNVICLFVRLIWLVTGSLMAIVIIFAGVKWLVSGDDAGARASAKTFIISAFVGLIIIFTAVPVVDYLVGGILGYEFACGFFPDVSSGVLSEDVPRSVGDETLNVKSVGPLAAVDPVLSLAGVSLGSSSGNKFFLCFNVSNSGEGPFVATGLAEGEEELVAYLYDGSTSLPYELCTTAVGSIPAKGSFTVYCEISREQYDLFRGNPLGYVLSASLPSQSIPDTVDVGKGLEDGPSCSGAVPETKLHTMSSDDNPVARIKVGDLDYSDSGEVVPGSDQLVVFHVLWSGESADYSWSIHLDDVKVTIPQNLKDKFNKQLLGLNSDEIEDVFKAPGTYTISVDVVGKDSEKKYPANTVTLNVVSASEVVVPVTADAKVGVIRGDEPAEFGKSARAKPGEKVVLKAENAKGTGTLKFLWEFNGKEYDKQLQALFNPNTGENFLPTDPAVYPVHLTVTDELGETYTEDVSIEILPRDAGVSISSLDVSGITASAFFDYNLPGTTLDHCTVDWGDGSSVRFSRGPTSHNYHMSHYKVDEVYTAYGYIPSGYLIRYSCMDVQGRTYEATEKAVIKETENQVKPQLLIDTTIHRGSKFPVIAGPCLEGGVSARMGFIVEGPLPAGASWTEVDAGLVEVSRPFEEYKDYTAPEGRNIYGLYGVINRYDTKEQLYWDVPEDAALGSYRRVFRVWVGDILFDEDITIFSLVE